MDQELFELDMERMYEDDSFTLDEANRELQEATAELAEEELEAVYDEYMTALMRHFLDPYAYSFE
jgi:hypothetical protein